MEWMAIDRGEATGGTAGLGRYDALGGPLMQPLAAAPSVPRSENGGASHRATAALRAGNEPLPLSAQPTSEPTSHLFSTRPSHASAKTKAPASLPPVAGC